MDTVEFNGLRRRLAKTQKQLGELLGTSLKAVQGYEQGWRRIPAHVERQLLFLAWRRERLDSRSAPCWRQLDCSPRRRERCPAHEFQAGTLCWFINGTVCHGTVQSTWTEKMAICRTCPVFKPLLEVRTGCSTGKTPCVASPTPLH